MTISRNDSSGGTEPIPTFYRDPSLEFMDSTGWKTANILPTPAVIANILPGEAVRYVIAAIRRL